MERDRSPLRIGSSVDSSQVVRQDQVKEEEGDVDEIEEFSEEDETDNDAHIESMLSHTLRLLGRQNNAQVEANALSEKNELLSFQEQTKGDMTGKSSTRHPVANATSTPERSDMNYVQRVQERLVSQEGMGGSDLFMPGNRPQTPETASSYEAETLGSLNGETSIIENQSNLDTGSTTVRRAHRVTDNELELANRNYKQIFETSEEGALSVIDGTGQKDIHRRKVSEVKNSENIHQLSLSHHQKEEGQRTLEGIGTGAALGIADKGSLSTVGPGERIVTQFDTDVIVISESSNSSEESEPLASSGNLDNGEKSMRDTLGHGSHLNETFTISEGSKEDILHGVRMGSRNAPSGDLNRKRSNTGGLSLEYSRITPTKVPRYKAHRESSQMTKANKVRFTETSEKNYTKTPSTSQQLQDLTTPNKGPHKGDKKPVNESESQQETQTPGKARRVPVSQPSQQPSSFTPLRLSQMKTGKPDIFTSPLTPFGRISGKPGRTPITTPATKGAKCGRIETPQEVKTKPGRTPIVTPSGKTASSLFETPKGPSRWCKDVENLASPMLGVSRSIGKPQRVKVIQKTSPASCGGGQGKARRVRRDGINTEGLKQLKAQGMEDMVTSDVSSI